MGDAATHVLLALDPSNRSALGELLSVVWRGANVPTAKPSNVSVQSGETRVKLPLLGDVEWRGVPDKGGVVLLEAAETSPLDTPHREGARPDVAGTLKLLTQFAASLERLLAVASVAPRGSAEFCRAAAGLLNPRGIGLSEDGTRLLFAASSEGSASALTPPYWTFFAAPEAVTGGTCDESTLVFGLAQVTLALLFGPAETVHGWQHLAAEDLAFKEFKRNPRAAKLPKEFHALLAKCLRPLPANRVTTLTKFRAALKKLVRIEGDSDILSALPVAAPLAKTPAVVIPAGMTLIEAGQFLSGEKKAPRTLRAFAIDITPVTEREYREFLKAINRDPFPDGPGSRGPKFDKHPVVNVTWREAEEFAEHYGKRLPTVYEWEKAARGNDGRKFPYGNDYLAGTGRLRANGINSAPGKEAVKETAPAGSFPKGASPFGILDTAGNVLEWTSTARRQGERIFRALKGACFLDGSVELSRCTAIQYKKPDARENCVGFRCVKDV